MRGIDSRRDGCYIDLVRQDRCGVDCISGQSASTEQPISAHAHNCIGSGEKPPAKSINPGLVLTDRLGGRFGGGLLCTPEGVR